MTTDNPSLSTKRPGSERPDEHLVEAIERMIRALAKRCAAGDPDTGAFLRSIENELRCAYGQAVTGWRTLGFSDTQIGNALGVTKQAVQQRWPRRP